MRHRSSPAKGISIGTSPRTSLPGPDDVLRRTLPNGITVLARENWSAPSVVVEGYLVAGGIDEPETLPGVATFTTSMLTRGTEHRTFAEISEQIENVGASVGFGADRHITSFSTKSLVEDLDLVFDVLADEIRCPVFPIEYIEKVRGMRMTSIAERENDTRQMASRALRALMYEGHILGRDLLGDRESNAAIQREDLIRFYDRYFAADGMTIVVVGAVRAAEAVDRVASVFGDWKKARPERPALEPVTQLGARREKHVSMPEKTQSDLFVGWHAMKRSSPDFEPARLANTVLGVFGMMGRLGSNVREKQGMAYSAYSRLGAGREPGIWSAIAGVNPANVTRATSAILDEVRRLRDEPVPADELEDSKRYLTGSLPLQLETNDGVASLLSDLEWFGLGLDYLEHYSDIVWALSADEVQRAAQKYMDPEVYALAVAGP